MLLMEANEPTGVVLELGVAVAEELKMGVAKRQPVLHYLADVAQNVA